jgi:hypothetical protein
MARLDTRIVSAAIPEDWLVSDERGELAEISDESPELHEWRMIVAFLQNC